VGIMSPFNWKITEAFPPINAHQTNCHYTGRCFDFSVQSPNFSSSEFCTRLKFISRGAVSRGFNLVAIEGLPTNSCSTGPDIIPQGLAEGVLRKAYVTSTVFHIHIQ
ncbi:MAG: hypothetical protein AAB617_01065, partial [Patescibacteria group bacterium]